MKRDRRSYISVDESVGYYDVKLMFPVLILVTIGIIMVYSASSVLAFKKFGTDFYFLKKQALFAMIGFVGLVCGRHFPYRHLKALAYPFLIIAIILLGAIFIPGIGYSAGGSARWLRLGGFTVQPSEFARLAMIIYLAYSLDKKNGELKNFYVGFLPHVFVLGILTALITMQPDFGSVVILGAITWLMLFVAGVRILHLAPSLLLLVPIGYIYMVSAEYRARRLMSFWDPWQYSANEGYQIIHSLMAFGTGGIWGTGIGQSYQKLHYLPEPHTDFIFSVIGEELGLLGVTIVLSLYVLILWRGIIIAKNAGDSFGTFLATGITSAIAIQVCTNMGVALGLLPTKGLTLPFLSYGGTSLLVNMASIGILMNIGNPGAETTTCLQASEESMTENRKSSEHTANSAQAITYGGGKSLRVIIAGGGTGGHLFPGIAIAQAFTGKNSGSEILFVGAGNRFEKTTVEKAGFNHRSIPVEGIKGRGYLKQLRSVFKIPKGMFESYKIIRDFKPDLVVGVGSYSSGPLVIMARLLRVKTALHEQNIIPGITNRILSRFADRVYVSFEETKKRLCPQKALLSGNPLRREIIDAAGKNLPAGSSDVIRHLLF